MTNGFTVSAFLPRGIRRGSLFLLSFAFALLFLAASSASAQTPVTWTVTTTGDSTTTTACNSSNQCATLRDAIVAADNDSGDTIDLTGLTGTIDLTSALPEITESMIIEGPGANLLTISGQGEYQIFHINISGTVDISGLTLADAATAHTGGAIHLSNGTLAVTDCTFSDDSAGTGGGAIGSGGTLTVTNSAFSDDDASFGGAITSSEMLTVANSTFSDDKANYGGAINGYGTLTVANSTFSDDRASGTDGGGAIYSLSTLSVTNSTFSGNSAARNGAAIAFGGIRLTATNSTFSGNSASYGGAININASGSLTATNDIFSGNDALAGQGGGIDNAGSGTVTESYNLFYSNDGGDISVNGNLQNPGQRDVAGKDPDLLTLGNYGGPTETMMPEPGSLAICAGNAADLTNALTAANSIDSDISTTADQRHFPIAPTVGACANGKIDIGSVQTNYLLVTNTSSDSGTVGSLPYEVSLANGQSYSDIGFDPSLGSLTITLSGRLSLTSGDTVIIGPPDEVTISSTGPAQILEVTGSTTTVTLYGVTLSGGSGSSHGGRP